MTTANVSFWEWAAAPSSCANVSFKGIAQRFQLVPGHAVRQRQQLQQAGRIRAFSTASKSLGVIFIPLLTVIVPELGPDSTATETNANARLTKGLNVITCF